MWGSELVEFVSKLKNHYEETGRTSIKCESKKDTICVLCSSDSVIWLPCDLGFYYCKKCECKAPFIKYHKNREWVKGTNLYIKFDNNSFDVLIDLVVPINTLKEAIQKSGLSKNSQKFEIYTLVENETALLYKFDQKEIYACNSLKNLLE